MGTGEGSAESIRRRMEIVREAIRHEDWELAQLVCDEGWTDLRAQIDRGERARKSASTNPSILACGGLELVHDSSLPFDREQNLMGDLRGPGTCRTYSVIGSSGVLLQLESFELDEPIAEQPVWVICRDALQSPPEFQRLTSGMRLGSKRTGRGGRSYDVGVARFNTGAKRGSAINKVGTAELNEIIDGDVEAILVQLGATSFGLRCDVLRDTSKRKNFLCAVDDTGSAKDLPAAIYFLTRVVPIARRAASR